MTESAKGREEGIPTATFICQAGDVGFPTRILRLDVHCKIGRSVNKLLPQPDNLIFNSKVLSRNHAVLYYENDRFFLQDTCSSNGTFVNKIQLSEDDTNNPSSSSTAEVFSGDIIQLGVDVKENEKTHSCVSGSLQLFHPNGQEAVKSSEGDKGEGRLPDALADHRMVRQLAYHLQEAVYREQVLESKLQGLSELLTAVQRESSNVERVNLDEDRLLHRLQMMETQIILLRENHSEDALAIQLVELEQARTEEQEMSEEALREVINVKMAAESRLAGVEATLTTRTGDCEHLKAVCQSLQEELDDLLTRYSEQTNEMTELRSRVTELEDAERDLIAADERAGGKQQEMDTRITQLRTERDEFKARCTRLESLLQTLESGKENVVTIPTAVMTNGDAMDVDVDLSEEPMTDGKNEILPPLDISLSPVKRPADTDSALNCNNSNAHLDHSIAQSEHDSDHTDESTQAKLERLVAENQQLRAVSANNSFLAPPESCERPQHFAAWLRYCTLLTGLLLAYALFHLLSYLLFLPADESSSRPPARGDL